MLTDTHSTTPRALPGWMMRRIPMLAILAVATMGLTGCYTQLAVLERPHGGLEQVVADYEDDGDILVRRYYEDGYVEEEVYNEYDWYNHRPYSYARYFDSFYGPAVGVSAHCWDLFYCDPFWGYTPSYSLAFGYGSWGVWGRPYASFGFGLNWGYNPHYYGVNYYRPYSHYPTWAWYGGSNYYNYGGVRAVTGNYAPRGETMARSALTSRTRGTRGGRDLNGIDGVRGGLNGRSGDFGSRTVVSTGRGSTATASKGTATGTRPSRGTLTGDRTARNTIGSTRTTTRSSATGTRATSREANTTRSTTRTTRSAIGTRDYGTSTRPRATTRTTGSSRAVPSRTGSRTSSGVGRSSNTRTRTSSVGRSTGSNTRSSTVRRSTGSSSRSSGVRRSSGSSSRSSGVRSSSKSSSSRSSGRSSSRSGRKN